MVKKKCSKCGNDMVGVSLLRLDGPPSRPSIGKSPIIGYQCKNCGHFEISSKITIAFTFRKDILVERALALSKRLTTSRCGAAIILINKTWLYQNREMIEIMAQVRGSQRLNKPTILMIDKDLTPPERKAVDRIFQGCNVISKIIFDTDDPKKFMPQLERALEEYIERGAEN